MAESKGARKAIDACVEFLDQVDANQIEGLDDVDIAFMLRGIMDAAARQWLKKKENG